MKEIKIYARAGQGAITTASLLGQAAFIKGKYAYAFPHFGAARMGAPMNAFVRIDDKPIRLRSQIYEPDCSIIVDSTLMRGQDSIPGLKSDGVAVMDEREHEEMPKPQGKQKVYVVPATKIALEVIGKPLANTVLLGSFAAATDLIDLESLSEAIKKRFSEKIAEVNITAVKRGYDFVKNSR
jgi:pyruvate ferredoxin oxidoreductase gamma subunit